MDKKEIVFLAARYADDKKGEDIKVMDMEDKSSLCDYVVIITATSLPHLEAIEEEISKNLKTYGVYKTNRDGRESGLWRISDYGFFMLHILTPETRSHYNLDEVFKFGKEIPWRKPAPQPQKEEKPAAVKPAKKIAQKPAAKKVVKKVTKKVAKKTTVKKAAPKTAKKVAKKPAAKKVAQKTAKKPAKKAVSGQAAKKVKKTPAAKKIIKKTVRKTAEKKKK